MDDSIPYQETTSSFRFRRINMAASGSTDLTAVAIDTSTGVYVGVHLALEGACNDNGDFCPESD